MGLMLKGREITDTYYTPLVPMVCVRGTVEKTFDNHKEKNLL
jgi:hypothetical protein